MLTGEVLSRGVARISLRGGGVTRYQNEVTHQIHVVFTTCCRLFKTWLSKEGSRAPQDPPPPGYSPVKTSESLKCQLTSCEKNQNTECQSKYNKEMRLGWPVLRKLWHIETTPFKKFMTNLKWTKLTRVPRYPTSTVKPKSYGDKTQMSFVREACIAFFPTWSLNFQIADTCTHCVPIF